MFSFVKMVYISYFTIMRGVYVPLLRRSTCLTNLMEPCISPDKIIESLNTGKFLHDGGLFSVSSLDRDRRFWRRKFFT